MSSLFTLAALIIFVYMTLGFVLSLIKKRNDVVDPMWGAGFGLVAIGTYGAGTQYEIPLLLVLLVIAWAVRLTTRLIKRISHKQEEDYRYKKWRDEWSKKGRGYFLLRSFLQIFMLQGFLMFIISLAFVAVNGQSLLAFNTFYLVGGFVVWMVGFFFEVVGDWQLSRFLSNPDNQGKIMQSGLWKYSRHPNYFGEATLWWGIWLIALSAGVPLWTIISPLTITYLLLKVSGVPMLEAQWKGNEAYEEYKKKTSVFVPGFPNK